MGNIRIIVLLATVIAHTDGDINVFRVASGYVTSLTSQGISTLGVYDLWSQTVFMPDLTSLMPPTVDLNLNAADPTAFKSPIIDCAWEFVASARVTIYSQGVPLTFFDFPANGSDKFSWFTLSADMTNPYTDLEEPVAIFSIAGAVNPGIRLNRRFLIEKNYPNCASDRIWLAVIEQNQVNPTCTWANRGGPDLPRFMYASAVDGVASSGLNLFLGDVFIVSVRMVPGAFGGGCVTSCANVADGSYHSCIGCDVYVKCSGRILQYQSCPNNMEWNDITKSCVNGSSQSCTNGKKADPQCKPGQSVTQPPNPVASEPPNTGNKSHVVLRVAAGYETTLQQAGKSPLTVVSLWTSPIPEPTLNFPVPPDAYSNNQGDPFVYKSNIVGCAWDKVQTVRVEYWKNNVEQQYIEFAAAGLTKMDWFNQLYVIDSSYTDVQSSNVFIFSINGFSYSQNNIVISRTFYIQQNGLTTCDSDTLWSSINEAPNTFCTWENMNAPMVPRIFYSPTNTVSPSANMTLADVFKISVKLKSDAFGGNCVSSCVDMPDGRYQSCIGCNVFVMCVSGTAKVYACTPGTIFDDIQKRCIRNSTTCFDRLADDACVPQLEQACRCFIFGDPVAELCDGTMFFFTAPAWFTTMDTRPYSPDCPFKAEVEVCKPNNLLICLYRITINQDVIRVDRNLAITVNSNSLTSFPQAYTWGSIDVDADGIMTIYNNCGLSVRMRMAATGVLQEVYNPGFIFEGICNGKVKY